MTYTIINDYLSNKTIKLLMDDAEFARLDSVWNNKQEDTLLAELQHFELFRGRFHISDLEPYHFRLMIIRNLYKMNDILKQDTIDFDDPIVSSLTFLICALIRSIETRNFSKIETIKIMRISETEIVVDFNATMTAEIPNIKKQTKQPGLSLVVDNDE